MVLTSSLSVLSALEGTVSIFAAWQQQLLELYRVPPHNVATGLSLIARLLGRTLDRR
jgi:hypothetical protein